MLVVAGSFIPGVSQQAKRQNEIISHQKELVEMKQKEIIDSINYAGRIQKSLLTPEAYINKILNKIK